MFIRFLAVLVGIAFMFWAAININAIIYWIIVLSVGLYGFYVLLGVVAFIIDGPQTPEQKAKDEQAIANIKEIWAKGLTNK
jgi:hypothetical protein